MLAGRAESFFVPPPLLGVPLLAGARLTPPSPRVVDRWNEKRALFGVYDNIGILGRTRFLIAEGPLCCIDSFLICGENSKVLRAGLVAEAGD